MMDIKKWWYGLYPLLSILSGFGLLWFCFHHWGYLVVLPIIGYTLITGCLLVFVGFPLWVWVDVRLTDYNNRRTEVKGKWQSIKHTE